MDNSSYQPVQPINETWQQLDKISNTVLRNLEKMSELFDKLINHSLNTECIPIPLPQRKNDHIKEREKYAKDYKQCILQQMSVKMNKVFTQKGAKAQCNICQMTCKNKKRFYIHLLQKHSRKFKFYCCIICHEKFDYFPKFKQHLCNYHDEVMIFQETEVILQIIDFGIRVISNL